MKKHKQYKRVLVILMTVIITLQQVLSPLAASGQQWIPMESSAMTSGDDKREAGIPRDSFEKWRTATPSDESEADTDDDLILDEDEMRTPDVLGTPSNGEWIPDEELLASMSNMLKAGYHRVQFYAIEDGVNVLIDEQYVPDGGCADAPDADELPEREGYTFRGWSGDYTKINGPRSILAQYYTGTRTLHTVDFVDHDGKLLKNRQYVLTGEAIGRPSDFKIMEQEAFEKLIMNKLLMGDREIFKDLNKQYEQAIVTSREFSGCGFFTTFDVQEYEPRYLVNGRIDDVAVEFGKPEDDACFILYVENGKIDTLEGFCFGDIWNNEYDKAKVVYCLPDQRRYELI